LDQKGNPTLRRIAEMSNVPGINSKRSITQMNLNTLKEFRHATYECFKQAGDALFNTLDALSSETAAHSFPELSLSPFFQRKWASLYEAFEDGKIDAERLRLVCVQFAPLPSTGQRVFLGVDTSNLYRPDAQMGADRTLVPMAKMPEQDHVVCPGWVISSVVLLPDEAGQGTFVLDTKPRDFLWAGDGGGGQPIAGRGRFVGGSRSATSDHRRPLVRLRTISGAHD
jgi:hypothetical protein